VPIGANLARYTEAKPEWTSQMDTQMDNLGQRLTAVRDRIARAAERARRDPAGILLLAVTKVFPAQTLREAYDVGLRDFGENYVQEFEGKSPELADLTDARYHFIGRLQSNKVKKAAELFHVIQTVDSAKLARRLNESPRPLDVMIEVKLSPEEAKSGAAPADLPELIAAVRACGNLRLLGLMTMPPWSADPEASRGYFRSLRELAGQHGLPQLSMGMSHDLETAIEEGSTCVRVGTALFGKRKKP
jgi:PLP dependent protein